MSISAGIPALAGTAAYGPQSQSTPYAGQPGYGSAVQDDGESHGQH